MADGSITLAAREMSLTQSAVSKQLSELEQFVGLKLVERTTSGIVPTVAGKEYLRRVTRIIDDLDDATANLMATRGESGSLNLSVVPSFTSFWLLPRLSDFAKSHPDITLNITTRAGIPDLKEEGLDVAIVTNANPPVRYGNDLVMGIEAYPVCAPSLIANRPVASLADVANLPLLHQSLFPEARSEFLHSQGFDGARCSAGPRYSILSLGFQAAVSGLGCALLFHKICSKLSIGMSAGTPASSDARTNSQNSPVVAFVHARKSSMASSAWDRARTQSNDRPALAGEPMLGRFCGWPLGIRRGRVTCLGCVLTSACSPPGQRLLRLCFDPPSILLRVPNWDGFAPIHLSFSYL